MTETLLFGAGVSLMLLWFSAQGRWAAYAVPLLYLLPLVLGLRYGFVAGLATGALASASMALVATLRPDPALLTVAAQSIGLLLVGMVAGQARDSWNARLRKLDALARYRNERLEQFTSAFHLLKVSHAQLEQRVAGGALNLRNALERLKQRAPQGSQPLAELAADLLHILVEQGDLYTAALYAVNERHLLCMPALAQAGNAPELSVFNPMLREALRTGRVTSAKAGADTGHDEVIAIVPLVDSRGHVHAVVAIYDMPFLAANVDTFGLLGVLGKHMGDILASRTRALDATGSVASLRESIQRHLVDAREHGVPTALLAFRIAPTSWRDQLVAHCSRSGRGLDQSWLAYDRQGHPAVFRLLPLTDELGAHTFMRRLQLERVGSRTAESGMVSYLWMLDRFACADDMIAEVGRTCSVDNLGLAAHSDVPALRMGGQS
ncbi:MAG: PelD GGDEF domain-containing protein [Hydrogenophaga sp.]|nr:PelD GGDEF domain-containing protein [Hydrogenophaga sp.]